MTVKIDGSTGVDKVKDIAALPVLPFTKEYVSAEQVVVSAGILNLPHNLVAYPKLVALELVCKVAEYGYSIGDVLSVPAQAGGYSTSNHGCTIKLTPASIDIRLGSQNAVFLVLSASGAVLAATNANWRLIVRAWA